MFKRITTSILVIGLFVGPSYSFASDKIKKLTYVANKGNVGLQKELANIYFHGLEVEKDCGKAIYWYEKAANNGDAISQHMLAEIYRTGDGVKKDLEKSKHWRGKVEAYLKDCPSCDLPPIEGRCSE